MSGIPLPPITYIDIQPALNTLAETLMQESLIAIDTESNSLHAYRERVCLIQLSTRTTDYIIDPLVIDDLSPLQPLMASETIEKVFHAAEYDITCMKRDFEFTFNNLFDTMMAARICGIKMIGLGNMLETYAGVKMDKSHQRDDWGQRPLPEESLRYAQMDTHFLPYLRDELYKALDEGDYLHEAQEAFYDVCQTPAAEQRSFDPDGFWKLGRPKRLRRREMMILREVYAAREHLAQELNEPPFKIISNNGLVAIARSRPNNLRELGEVKGIFKTQVRLFGDDILDAVERGKQAKTLPKPPKHKMPAPDVQERYKALRTWRKHRAVRRGVESDVIVSKQTLWDLAYKAPATLADLQEINGLGPWRLQTYAHEILNVLGVEGD